MISEANLELSESTRQAIKDKGINEIKSGIQGIKERLSDQDRESVKGKEGNELLQALKEILEKLRKKQD